jgi:glutamate 5-kinase
VIGIRGDFRTGDAVRVLSSDGTEIARGLVQCAASDAARVAGQRARDLANEDRDHTVLIHRDELVVGAH